MGIATEQKNQRGAISGEGVFYCHDTNEFRGTPNPPQPPPILMVCPLYYVSLLMPR